MASPPSISQSFLVTIIWVAITLAISFVAFRTWIRLHKIGRLYEDDVLVYLALIILTTMGVLYHYAIPPLFQVEAVSNGNEAAITPDFESRAVLFLKLQFGIILLFWSCLWTVKFSFLFFLRRMFAGTYGIMIYWWGAFAFVLLAYIGCWITQLLSCEPLSSYFVLGACNSERDIYISNLSLRYATAVMALPLPVLWNLRINAQQKIGLAVIFCLGLITIIFAIVRVIETNATKTHVDPIWLALWSMIECAVAVIVSCLPSLKALIRAGGSSKYNSRGPSNTTANKKGVIRLRQMTGTGSSRTVTAAPGTSTSEEHIMDKGGIHVSHEFVSHP